jgi:hypothetical protein
VQAADGLGISFFVSLRLLRVALCCTGLALMPAAHHLGAGAGHHECKRDGCNKYGFTRRFHELNPMHVPCGRQVRVGAKYARLSQEIW